MTASVTTKIEFTDPAQHTFDSATVELSNGKAQLKSQVDPTEILFSNFDTDADLVSKRGDKTIVFTGVNNTGQILGGILDFPNEDRSRASYQNITDIVDDFAFRAKVIMNVDLPSTSRDVVQLNSNIDDSNILFWVSNGGSGLTRMNFSYTDSSGTTASMSALATRTIVAGDFWNVAFSNDDDGDMLIWIDGALEATIVSVAFDFTDCDFIFGEDANGTTVSIASFDNVQLFFSNAIITADAFPFPEDTTYVLTPQQIDTPIQLQMDIWEIFSNIVEILNSSQVKHQVKRNSLKYWYNTSWEEVDLGQDLFSQSNTATEINDNLSTFPLSVGIGVSIEILSFLKSSADGYTTPLLDQISLSYGASFKPAEVVVCAVVGKIVDMSGNPVVGASIIADSQSDFFNEDCLVSKRGEAVSNSEGIWSMSLIETTTISVAVKFTFQYTENSIAKTFKVRNKLIPSAVTVDFADLLDAPES